MDPEHLYKYRSLDGEADRKRTRQILVENRLWFPRPSDFNDPFDCKPGLSTAATATENAKWIKALFKEKAPALGMPRVERRLHEKKAKQRLARNGDAGWLDTIVENTVNSAGVLSLSACRDHILMWSHYAAAHRGVCLRFKAGRTTAFFGRAQPVRYSETRPVLNLVRDVRSGRRELTEKLLLTKADFWSYEEEWRIVEHDHGPGGQRFPAELLDGAILGANIQPARKAEVLEWVAGRQSPVAIYEARPDPALFRLNIVPLNEVAAAESSEFDAA